MARLRITAGGIWKAFYWTLAGAAFWFVYDGVQHPEKFDDKTLPPSAVESRLPGGAFRANLPEVSLNYTGAVEFNHMTRMGRPIPEPSSRPM